MSKLRPQYHFQPSPRGLLAWSVKRLIELSAGLPVQHIPLSAVREFDHKHWFTDQNPTPRAILEHAKLIRDADLSYPIILDANGHLMDGMHRVCKAMAEGRSHIDARQFAVTPEPDYIGKEPQDLPYNE